MSYVCMFRYNRPKDYLQVAGLLGVTHVAIVSQTESNTIYKVARAPQGPTLHFKVSSQDRKRLLCACPCSPFGLFWRGMQVLQYSLMKHVRALQKHPFESAVSGRCQFAAPLLRLIMRHGFFFPSGCLPDPAIGGIEQFWTSNSSTHCGA